MLRRRRSSFFCFPFSSYRSPCRRPPPPLPSIKPPVPKKTPSTATAHGVSWDDPYRWMSNRDDPDLCAHLARENSYADAFMADTRDLQRSLVAEMTARMPPAVSTPPEPWGPWLYYQYIPEGKEYPILCRRLRSPKGFVKQFFNYMRSLGKEEVLLDWNEIAELHGYVHIGTCRISPDHKFLAYTLDTSGSELFSLKVKDLSTGCIISHTKVEGVVSLAWASDNSSLLYTVCDETQRPNRVFCTKLGSDAADDLLFTENELSCCVDITSTKDGKFITINSNSRSSSEEENLTDGLWLVRERLPGVQYFLEHHYGLFYILTNAPLESINSVAEGYHLARCKTIKSLLDKWRDIVLPGEGITFQDMDIFHGHLVLSLQKNGLPMFCSIKMPIDLNDEQLVNLEDLNPWFFPLPTTGLCSIMPGSNHDFTSSTYRVVVSSPVMPDVVVDYDLIKQGFSIVHREEMAFLATDIKASSYSDNLHSDQCQSGEKSQSGEDLQRWSDLNEVFSCTRREVNSHDGVMIPLTILHSQNARRNGQSPGLLYGYGAYGEVLDKSWCADHINLLARGWVIAYADVRGGGDFSWHQAGRGLNKLNSIYDFAACGVYLVSEGYVHKDWLGAIGCSAGGLLVGATINKYPNLFSAAILKVPFLDICNTLLDPKLPLTILDYDEFGDPSVLSEFKKILSYSPYDNIVPGVCYPSMLVTASFHDSRVGVWEAAKWVARVRELTCSRCSRSVILKTDLRGGHLAEGGRFRHCGDAAFEHAFLFKAMGLLDDQKCYGN